MSQEGIFAVVLVVVSGSTFYQRLDRPEHGIGSLGGIFSGSWVNSPNGRWMLAWLYPLHDAGTIIVASSSSLNNDVAVVSSCFSGHSHLVESHLVLEHLEEAPQQHASHDDPGDVLAASGGRSLKGAAVAGDLADPLHRLDQQVS